MFYLTFLTSSASFTPVASRISYWKYDALTGVDLEEPTGNSVEKESFCLNIADVK